MPTSISISGSPERLVDEAAALMASNRPFEAESYLRRAAELQPDLAESWNNLGRCLRQLNRIPEAIEYFDRAIAIEGSPVSRYDRAYALLLEGEYVEGFREFEQRWEVLNIKRPRETDSAVLGEEWDGQDLHGKSLLVYADQGFGDSIQFVRYVPQLKAAGADIVLEVQPSLRRLMTWMEPRCIVGCGRPIKRFDYHASLMSLPGIFGTTLDTIPAPAKFAIPIDIRDKWRERTRTDGLLKVGIAWAGNPQNSIDYRRSIPFSLLQPLLGCEGARFFSFQVGARSGDASFDLSAELTDFAETAAALLSMDLVITVDTSVAHLACSLGLPAWILLPFAPCWRWLLEREDSPWYPSAHLIRQPAPGDWQSVIARALRLAERR